MIALLFSSSHSSFTVCPRECEQRASRLRARLAAVMASNATSAGVVCMPWILHAHHLLENGTPQSFSSPPPSCSAAWDIPLDPTAAAGALALQCPGQLPTDPKFGTAPKAIDLAAEVGREQR
jgi:hypothetical protein